MTIRQIRATEGTALRDIRLRAILDTDRESGRGYYVGACFRVYASNGAGEEFELVDGGLTTWTQQLLSNAKERLLVSGLGVDLLCSRFNAINAPAN